jgi:GT2 family glycosyltransferase
VTAKPILNKSSSAIYKSCANPDIVFNNQTIKIMYSYMVNNDNTGIVGCKVIDFNGHFQKSSRRRFPSVLNSLSFFLNLAGFNLLDYFAIGLCIRVKYHAIRFNTYVLTLN